MDWKRQLGLSSATGGEQVVWTRPDCRRRAGSQVPRDGRLRLEVADTMVDRHVPDLMIF